MLAKMCQLCPASEDKTALFLWMFLRRLPDKVKLMLAEDHTSSVTEHAARSDILTPSAPKLAETVASPHTYRQSLSPELALSHD